MHRHALFCLLGLSMTIAFISGEDYPVRVADTVVGQVDHRLFGQFMELLEAGKGEQGGDAGIDPATGRFPPKLATTLADMHMPVVRYPGGTMIEGRGWRWTQLIDGPDSGDPLDERRHALGLHEFLDWCEEIDTEPILVVKLADMVLGVVPPELIRDQARAMIAYVTQPANAELDPELRRWVDLRIANGRRDPWRVRYWQIGNEFTWSGVPPLRKQGLDDAAITSRYVEACGELIDALRAVEPDIEIIVEVQMEEKWKLPVTALIAERLGDRVQHLTHHMYLAWGIHQVKRDGQDLWPGIDFSPEDYWWAVVSAGSQDRRGMSQFRAAVLQEANRHGYPLAITEWNWNSWWGKALYDESGVKPEPFLEPLWAKGVAAASGLHGFMCADGRISIATQSMLIGTGWPIRAVDVRDGVSLRHPSGMVTTLYSRYHGSEVLAFESDIPTYRQPFTLGYMGPKPAVALVDVVVTRSDEHLFLHLINRSYGETQVLAVDTGAVLAADSVTALVHRLTGEMDDEVLRDNQLEVATLSHHALGREPGKPWRIELPPQCVQVVAIPVR